MSSLKIPAVLENLESSIDFVKQQFTAAGFGDKELLRIHLACEEAFVNVINYAYQDGQGDMIIDVTCRDDSCTIMLSDQGVPYDPMAKEDPDLDVPIEERQIGGLGIFMVKEIMDDVRYEYRDGYNILTLVKRRP